MSIPPFPFTPEASGRCVLVYLLLVNPAGGFTLLVMAKHSLSLLDHKDAVDLLHCD